MTSTVPSADAAMAPMMSLFSGPLGPRPGSAAAAETFAVRDPSTGLTIARVAEATLEDASRMVELAQAGFETWSAAPARERAKLIMAIHALLEQRRELFVRLMTLEMGKTFEHSRREIDLSLDYLVWFSQEAGRIDGISTPSPDGDFHMLTVLKPLGIALLVTPWNFPLLTIVRKLGAALAAGCSAVLKPSEETPLTAIALADLVAEAGAPEGVFCVLTTSRPQALVAQMMDDPRVRKISFTGSFQVGSALQARAGRNMMRSSMELGGNAPFIVFEDADLALAVQHAVAAKLSSSGQVCTAPNRFLVHRSCYERFCDLAAAAFGSKTAAPGHEDGANLGPLVNEAARSRILELIADATRLGATLRAGGAALPREGYFLAPTVVTDVPQASMLWQKEIFGPVIQIAPFDDEDQAVRMANAGGAGLSGYVYTANIARTLRLARKLQVGMLGVNRTAIVTPRTPFGGVGLAGIGHEGGYEGVAEYLDMTCVGIS